MDSVAVIIRVKQVRERNFIVKVERVEDFEDCLKEWTIGLANLCSSQRMVAIKREDKLAELDSGTNLKLLSPSKITQHY